MPHQQLEPVSAPADLPLWARLGDALRERGYSARTVAQALGIIAWNGPDMDSPYWLRRCLADGEAGDRVQALVRGEPVSQLSAERALPPEARQVGLLACRAGWCQATATLLPLGRDLVWTDRADRAFASDDGLFLPDSTTLAVRRCLPPGRVGRHLDIGSGAGAVTVAAARRANTTLAVDINPRAGLAALRSAALSGVDGVSAFTCGLEALAGIAPVDRLSFVLPLLMGWQGLDSGPMQDAPVHTVARTRELLTQTLRALPTLLAPGGVAILYCQAWVGEDPLRPGQARALPDAIDQAFDGRAWRGAFWWDFQAPVRDGLQGQRAVLGTPVPVTRPLRSGILALRADAAPDERSHRWVEAACDAPAVGTDDWWPLLAPLLGWA